MLDAFPPDIAKSDMSKETIMKRMLVTWIAMALLIYPATCMGAYLIELKNGKTFFISEYWEEGGQVKFPYYGGVVAIDKDQIRSVQESDVPYIEVQEVPVKEPEPEPASAQAKPEAQAQGEEATAPKEVTAEAKKLLEEFKVAKERFDSFRYVMTYDELFKFSEELLSLRSRFFKEKLHYDFQDKVTEIFAMEEKVQAILSQRHQ
jgi:hypothetical protein